VIHRACYSTVGGMKIEWQTTACSDRFAQSEVGTVSILSSWSEARHVGDMEYIEQLLIQVQHRHICTRYSEFGYQARVPLSIGTRVNFPWEPIYANYILPDDGCI
jgi:hypothetical protein